MLFFKPLAIDFPSETKKIETVSCGLDVKITFLSFLSIFERKPNEKIDSFFGDNIAQEHIFEAPTCSLPPKLAVLATFLADMHQSHLRKKQEKTPNGDVTPREMCRDDKNIF